MDDCDGKVIALAAVLLGISEGILFPLNRGVITTPVGAAPAFCPSTTGFNIRTCCLTGVPYEVNLLLPGMVKLRRIIFGLDRLGGIPVVFPGRSILTPCCGVVLGCSWMIEVRIGLCATEMGLALGCPCTTEMEFAPGCSCMTEVRLELDWACMTETGVGLVWACKTEIGFALGCA